MCPRTRSLALLAAVALAATVAAGCGGEPESRADERQAPRAVRVVPAARGALPDVVAVSGTLAAEEEVALGMKVAGRLGAVAVDLGSRVAKGQVLARLVPADFELRVRQTAATLEQARAVLAEAQARRDRARALFAEQLLPQADLDTAEASFQVAQAVVGQRRSELDLARQQRADSVLVAPFAGAVRERQAVPGQFVTAGQPVATLVRIHPLRLRLAVPEREAAKVRSGQAVRVTLDGDPRAYAGRVARLSSSRARAFASRASVASSPGGVTRWRIVWPSQLPSGVTS